MVTVGRLHHHRHILLLRAALALAFAVSRSGRAAAVGSRGFGTAVPVNSDRRDDDNAHGDPDPVPPRVLTALLKQIIPLLVRCLAARNGNANRFGRRKISPPVGYSFVGQREKGAPGDAKLVIEPEKCKSRIRGVQPIVSGSVLPRDACAECALRNGKPQTSGRSGRNRGSGRGILGNSALIAQEIRGDMKPTRWSVVAGRAAGC
jgi:hypothetical protein